MCGQKGSILSDIFMLTVGHHKQKFRSDYLRLEPVLNEELNRFLVTEEKVLACSLGGKGKKEKNEISFRPKAALNFDPSLNSPADYRRKE